MGVELIPITIKPQPQVTWLMSSGNEAKPPCGQRLPAALVQGFALVSQGRAGHSGASELLLCLF